MTKIPAKTFMAVAFSAASSVIAASALAAWPNDQVIRMVVPFAAGGSTDLVARKLAEGVAKELNANVIVENKAGAGGTVGSAYVARQPADGYTILMGTVSTNASASCVYPSLAYDPVRDFTPLAVVATIPNVLDVNQSVPADTLKEFVDLVKKHPEKYSFASNGVGTSNHLAAELFLSTAGITMIHAPYRGSGPAMIDLVGGQVDAMMDVVMTSYPYIKDKKLKALAVTSRTRSSLLPDVPTVAEQGYPGFEAMVWFGVFGPANLPANITERLNKALAATIHHSPLKQYLLDQGAEPSDIVGEAFKAMVTSEVAKWCGVTKQANIKLN
ncbi:ABC transporter substrate-binding protein [Pollutimonas nitritireducens]|uniref:ABC transporter substrate-binding protein n=1 Tax=Pollutimonas nitritireducens TaxID=2045209 RepID=A0A2N4UKZ7_9BURK|nr:tripartite tricarboxylate transporter substrate binding protein [Pollutimonas nitritireducens]PLC55693.1 ABC transporter substrate-binding protein [Pollutimonas nitritireducens]